MPRFQDSANIHDNTSQLIEKQEDIPVTQSHVYLGNFGNKRYLGTQDSMIWTEKIVKVETIEYVEAWWL